MKKAAFLSYNSVLGFDSGWSEGEEKRKALIIQCSRGFAAPKFRNQEQCREVSKEVDRLWEELEKNSEELDLVVVYVGGDGSENAISLASKLPADKIVFVMCPCKIGEKVNLIRRFGLGYARRINCECRGTVTMSILCKNFLRTGDIFG